MKLTDSELKKTAIAVINNPVTGNGLLPEPWLSSLLMTTPVDILVTFYLNATVKFYYLICGAVINRGVLNGSITVGTF